MVFRTTFVLTGNYAQLTAFPNVKFMQVGESTSKLIEVQISSLLENR